MRLIISYDGAGFDALASMVAAGLLHPGAEMAAPQNMHGDTLHYLEENEGLLRFADPFTLDTSAMDELIVVGSPEGRTFSSLSSYREKAARVRVYANPPVEGGGAREAHSPAGSLTALMVRLLEHAGITLSPPQANLLALGIYQQTGGLTDQAASGDFHALAYLFDQGADLNHVIPYTGGEQKNTYRLFFKKVVNNYRIRSIAGFRVLFCQGEVWDYLEGIGFLIRELLLVAEAHMAVVVFPFHGNNYINAFTKADTALDLKQAFTPYEAEGGTSNVSFFKEGDPAIIIKDLEVHLYKALAPGVTARDVMNTYVKSISPEMSLAKAKEQMEKRGSLSLPVASEKGFTGVIALQQLYKAIGLGYGEDAVEKFMDKTRYLARPDTPLNALFRQMATRERDMIPVVDSQGHLQGAVTYVELLQALYREENPLIEGPTAIATSLGGSVKDLIEERLPEYLQGILYLLGKTGETMGVAVHAVGGFVRDLILGLQSEDLDVVVEGDALMFAGKMNELLRGKLTENPDFGTARIVTSRQTIDFSTARQEFYAFAASLPEVEGANLKKDLFRRDFTMNTLAFQLNPDRFGRLYDYYKGLEDMEAKTIRVLYNLSFVDDPLRILRAVRFSVRLGFQIEPETRGLIKSALKSKVLNKASKDRLTRELELAFRENKVMLVVKELAELGILSHLFPHVSLTAENYRIIKEMEELIIHQDPEERGRINPLPLYIAGLLFGSSQRDFFSRLHRIRLTRGEMDIVTSALSQGEAAAKILADEGLPPEQVYDIFNGMAVETSIFVLALAGNSRAKEYHEMYTKELRRLSPTLTGRELINMGFEPGPIFKDILQKLKLEMIKGKIQSVEDEIYFIQKNYQLEKGMDI